ncbi:MAG TPA: glycosyltransferase [Longimicrobiales bacterium]
MNRNPPAVSIVIPTRNRCEALRRTLDALARQTVPAEAMEVIVVADGCTDDTTTWLREYRPPYRLRCVELPHSGPATARNAGAAAAAGEILLFIDDDIESAPGLVAAHLRSHEGSADVVAIGPYPPFAPGRQDFVGTLFRRWWSDLFTAIAEPGHRFTYRDVLTGNLSLRRTLFLRVGGFDAAFPDPSHEDWEFGIRLVKAGARLTYVADAAAWHHNRTDLDRTYRRAREDGNGDVLMGRLHPELLPTLPLAHRGLAPRPVENAVRALAFRAPAIGDSLARLARRVLDVLEWLRLRRAWRRLSGATQRYWYWRGVADALGSQAELARFLAHGSGAGSTESALDIDLRPGFAEAERRLDVERPAAVRVWYGDVLIGQIPPVPGAERLRGRHLRPLLARHLGVPLLNAKAIEALATSPRAPVSELATARREGPLDAPLFVAESDLSRGVHDLEVPRGYGAARVLVRVRGRPLGWMTIPSPSDRRIPATELRKAISEQFGPGSWPALLGYTDANEADGAQREGFCPPITVVVCTRDRTEMLAGCLRTLLELDYPEYEVIVVDNAPSDERTARLAADLGVRYVREDVPGLDRARNRGIRAARYDIVAFTDDDVRVDPGWLREVAAAFADPELMAVTGLVAPLTLDTAAERLFELEYGGLSQRTRQRTFRRSEMRNAQLLWASGIGCGANMAYRKRIFDALGGFDVALDAGTLAGTGGDIEMLHRIVASGHAVAYRPTALVWHRHRPTLPALRRQLFDNGRGFGAYLITCFRKRTVPRHAILRFAFRDWLGRWILRRLVRPGAFPRGLVIAEMAGAILSPFFYLGAQWEQRGRPAPAPAALAARPEPTSPAAVARPSRPPRHASSAR